MTIIGKTVTSPFLGPFSGPGEVRHAREKAQPQEVQPVERIKPSRRDQNDATRQAPFAPKNIAEDRRSEDRRNAARRPQDGPTTADPGATQGQPAAVERDSGFITQLLFQDDLKAQNAGKAQRAESIRQHPQGAALGSEVYRLAGAEPSLHSKEATFISIAV